MSPNNSYLVHVLYGQTIMKCAVQIERSLLSQKCLDGHFSSIDVKNELHDFLPLHVRRCGPIVEIEHLFDIHVVKKGGI